MSRSSAYSLVIDGSVNGNATVFAITPDQLKSSWIGEIRLLSGGMDLTWKLAAEAECIAANLDYSVRASLSVAF